MDHELRRRLDASGYYLPGFAALYDAARPRPPLALTDLLPALCGSARPRLVVDLGSGTGLSTRFWAATAEEVVGVEPNGAMRSWAQRATAAPNVRYLEAPAEHTGLPDACADIVTAAQSLQWLDPGPTFSEVARILRPGGVFCAFEYYTLQTPLWQPEAVWAKVRELIGRRRSEHGMDVGRKLWPTGKAPLESSGVFRFVGELALHSIERGDGERLLGWALSEGSLQTLLAAGVSEEEVGLDELRRVASSMATPVEWWIGYRAWIGLR